jgi:hypothetical protein
MIGGMKIHPLIREALLICMQALGLAPMTPVRVGATRHLDHPASAGPGVDSLE